MASAHFWKWCSHSISLALQFYLFYLLLNSSDGKQVMLTSLNVSKLWCLARKTNFWSQVCMNSKDVILKPGWLQNLGINTGTVEHMYKRHLSASAVVIHYEETLYQVYGPLPLPLPETWSRALLTQRQVYHTTSATKWMINEESRLHAWETVHHF